MLTGDEQTGTASGPVGNDVCLLTLDVAESRPNTTVVTATARSTSPRLWQLATVESSLRTAIQSRPRHDGLSLQLVRRHRADPGQRPGQRRRGRVLPRGPGPAPSHAPAARHARTPRLPGRTAEPRPCTCPEIGNGLRAYQGVRAPGARRGRPSNGSRSVPAGPRAISCLPGRTARRCTRGGSAAPWASRWRGSGCPRPVARLAARLGDARTDGRDPPEGRPEAAGARRVADPDGSGEAR